MNAFDLIILALLAALTLRGIWKGMVSQIVSVASFFVCWVVASRFGSLVAPTIPLESPWNQVAAMAIIFLITLVAVRFAHAILEKLIKDWHLAKLNSLSGGLLGFVKGLLLCLIITFFAVMVSETTRDVVFNAKTGPSLVQMITQIGVFVPKDSYEFVHSQLAQFQDKIEESVPGEPPETLQVQSSEAVKRVLAQLQQVEMPQEIGASSLMSAISNWWNGTQAQAAEVAEHTVAEQNDGGHFLAQPAAQTMRSANIQEPSVPPVTLPAASYTPPMAAQPMVPANSANTFSNSTQQNIPQMQVPKPVMASSTEEQFFVRRTEPAAGSQMQPLQSLPLSLPAVPEPSLSASSLSAPMTTLSPLSELPASSMTQLLPSPAMQRHVGSELLLRNSMQSAAPRGSARVFQHR